jgi:diguanylate cyclase (GGDEF)-like protein
MTEPTITPVVRTAIRSEQDTIMVRQLAQQVTELAGFTAQERTRFATAVSEITRNALKYARGGNVSCNVIEKNRTQYIEFIIEDAGPGISNLGRILSGQYRSKSGMGLGIKGSKKLVDRFDVKTGTEGTTVTLGIRLHDRCERATDHRIKQWAAVLSAEPELSAVEDVQQRQTAMIRELAVLRQREEELRAQLESAEKQNLRLTDSKRTLTAQATYDNLTGLLNRRAIFETLDHEIDICNRAGKCVSVVMADIDHFKNLNDTYGHPAGDEALRETSHRIQETLRGSDFVGRYGGEEFLMVLPRSDQINAMVIAERVREAVSCDTVDLEGTAVTITISLGVSTSDAIKKPDLLIDMADAALYRAKQGGRNRVEVGCVADVAEKIQNG